MGESQSKILVMDDEKHVRDILKKVLIKFGHHVELTKNGEEAVTRYKELLENNSPADLVILDLSVPGAMGGKEASEIILEMDPEANIMISSGNINDPVIADYESLNIRDVLPKPFRLDVLKTKVEQILNP